MTNIYDKSKLDKLKNKLTLYRIIFYILLGILLGIEITFSCLIEYKNKNIFQPLMISIGIVLSLVLLFLFLYFMYPNKWLINRINFMNNSIKHEIKGKVISINQTSTLRRDIEGLEIVIKNNKDDSTIFLEDIDEINNIEVNKEYVFNTYDNFIVSYEESHNEKTKK